MDHKLSKPLYMLAIARSIALRSTCPRRAVGAVLCKDWRIISTGYNGAPPGMTSCIDDFAEGDENPLGCLMYEGHCINTIHAEMNCLVRAREQGDVLVTTDQPCLACLKSILSHNPKLQIYYWRDYPDPARDLFVQHHSINNLMKFLPPSILIVEEALKNA